MLRTTLRRASSARRAARRAPARGTARPRRPARARRAGRRAPRRSSSGARLVVSTRRSAVVETRKATSSATAPTRCSQLSSTSRLGACAEPLRDAAADVGALLRRQRPLRADRVAHAEHGADLADHVLGRGDADELDDVHDRLRGVAREHVGQPRLAEAARPDDRDHARVGRAARAAGATSSSRPTQRARVVAHAARAPGGRAPAGRDARAAAARRDWCRAARAGPAGSAS